MEGHLVASCQHLEDVAPEQRSSVYKCVVELVMGGDATPPVVLQRIDRTQLIRKALEDALGADLLHSDIL